MALTPLTPMAIAVLALLFERAMHPYEMYQLLIARKEDRLLKIRPGSLYHTVDRLAERELVASVGTDRDGNRPERTTYEVTDAGKDALRQRLTELLGQPAEEFPQFTLALSEAHNLSAEAASALLKNRIELLQKDLDDLLLIAESVVSKRVYYVGLEYTIAMRTAELSWLRGFVLDIDTGSLDWQPHNLSAALKEGLR
ncbi:PadR family transcriptional regulator [Actinomycetes bacterium M1A6_2h]